MSSFSSSFTAALVLLSSAGAYAHVANVVVDGVAYEGYNPSTFPLYYVTPTVIGWAYDNKGGPFVTAKNFSHPDIICHRSATPAGGHAVVKAGDKVSLQLQDPWPLSQRGPVIDYLANCNGPCENVNKTDLEFFKIAAGGYGAGAWATDIMAENDDTWMVQIPEDLEPGEYVLRHEILALDEAPTTNGAKSYPQCFNFEVTGSGKAKPSGVLGTELYKADDSGILFNIFGPFGTYPVPGPALIPGVPSSIKQSIAVVTTTREAVTTDVAVPIVPRDDWSYYGYTTTETTATSSTSTKSSTSTATSTSTTAKPTPTTTDHHHHHHSYSSRSHHHHSQSDSYGSHPHHHHSGHPTWTKTATTTTCTTTPTASSTSTSSSTPTSSTSTSCSTSTSSTPTSSSTLTSSDSTSYSTSTSTTSTSCSTTLATSTTNQHHSSRPHRSYSHSDGPVHHHGIRTRSPAANTLAAVPEGPSPSSDHHHRRPHHHTSHDGSSGYGWETKTKTTSTASETTTSRSTSTSSTTPSSTTTDGYGYWTPSSSTSTAPETTSTSSSTSISSTTPSPTTMDGYGYDY